MKKILTSFVDQSLFVNLISILFVVVGILTMKEIPREIFPNVNFDMVLVNTSFLGASTLEVENLVTNPIEEELREISSTKEIHGFSIEGISMIVIVLDPDTTDKRSVFNDIEAAVEKAERELPTGVEKTTITELKNKDLPIIELSLYGNVPYDTLRESAKDLKKIVENVPGIAKVETKGYEDKEIWVQADPKKLSAYHITLSDLYSIIQKNNISTPGGLLKGKKEDVIIRTLELVHTPKDIENLVIRKSYSGSGNLLRIKDVAKVHYAYEEPQFKFRTNQRDAVRLVIVKKENVDAIRLVAQVKKIVKESKDVIAEGISTEWVNDLSFYVSRRLSIITQNGLVGILLVLFILFLLLNPWVALWTALAIPLVICISITVCYALGINLHLIAMFAFVLVLGMLVDDSIIVGENIFRHMEMGSEPKLAAKEGLIEVVKPVSTTIITTVAAFSPLMFMPGIMGKFIWSIPVVVSVTLIASWLESFFVLPNHLSAWVPKHLRRKIQLRKESLTYAESSYHWLMTPIKKIYYRLLARSLRLKYLVILLFTLTLAGAGYLVKSHTVPFVLFSSDGIETFFVRIELKRQASLEATEEEVIKVEKYVLEGLKPNELDFVNAMIGRTEAAPNDPNFEQSSNIGHLTVRLSNHADRTRTAPQIIHALTKHLKTKKDIQAKVVIKALKPGPPSGHSVAVRIIGDDFENLKKVANRVIEEAMKIPGVRDMDHNLKDGKDEWRIKVDKVKAAELEVETPMIAFTIQAAFNGIEASTIRTVNEAIEIRLRLDTEYRIPKKEFVENLTVPNKSGRHIPLSRLITIEKSHGYLRVPHYNFERYAYVYGDIDESLTTPIQVQGKLSKQFSKLKKEFPKHKFSFAGEIEDTQSNLDELLRMFVMAFGLIFIILASTFNSVLQPFIIMLCVPFSFIGIVAAFFLHGKALNFLAMIGAVGLVGVVVNDSIIYTDFINKEIANGKNHIRAILEAGQHRIRPILLTTLTTVLGILPTAYGVGGLDPFLVPMALSISWGLAFGTFITLFLLPCLYAVFFDLYKLPFVRRFDPYLKSQKRQRC